MKDQNVSKVENILISADTKATIEACKKFGAIIELNDSTVIVKESIKIGSTVPEINTENSGTTIDVSKESKVVCPQLEATGQFFL